MTLLQEGEKGSFYNFHRSRVSRTAVSRRVVTMFLGGSYHDRDNPHKWGVSHGQLIVFITLVCSQKEGRQQSSSSRGGLRTSIADDEMRMMMMTIFYTGIGTKPTGNINSNPKQCTNQASNPTPIRQWRTMTIGVALYGNTNTTTNTNNHSNMVATDGRSKHGGTTIISRGCDSAQQTRTRMRHYDDDDEEGNLPVTGTTDGNNNNINNNNSQTRHEPIDTNGKSARSRRHRTWRTKLPHQRDEEEEENDKHPQPTKQSSTDNNSNNNTTTTNTRPNNTSTNTGAPKEGLNTSAMAGPTRDEDDGDDRWSQQTREDDNDGDDGDHILATGTLDRKTSQASPKACLYTNQHKMTREA
jgi:hypothetical protein